MANFAINGIILAGGKSSRMNCDKAFLKLGSKTIIEELIMRLKKKFSRFIIVANDKEKYMKFGAEVISDILPNKGPLGGIYTGLVKSDSFYNFIFACDTPFLNIDLIEYMVTQAEGADVIVPNWKQKFEPLHAIYSKECIRAIEKQLQKDDLKITNFFSEVKVKEIKQEKLETFNLGESPFININTKEDYIRVIAKGN